MPEDINTSPEVVISSDEPSPAAKRSRKRKTRAKKRPAFIADMAETSKSDEAPSQVWFTAISNLALLVALFTIIFAAHHAFRKNKIVAVPDAKKEIATTTAKEVPNNVDNTGAVTETKTEQTITDVQEENVEKSEQTPKEKIIRPSPIARTDPFTNGGPLDLDRKAPGNTNVEAAFKDSANPWNGGGSLDLDSQTAREQYKNNYLSSNESDK